VDAPSPEALHVRSLEVRRARGDLEAREPALDEREVPAHQRILRAHGRKRLGEALRLPVGVPMRRPASVRSVASARSAAAARATPKSITFGRPPESTSTLAGLRSRWITPF
jgi:hypothetical protein